MDKSEAPVSSASRSACLNTLNHLNANFSFLLQVNSCPVPTALPISLLVNDFSWVRVESSKEAIRKFYLQKTALGIHVKFINYVLLEIVPILDQMLRN